MNGRMRKLFVTILVFIFIPNMNYAFAQIGNRISEKLYVSCSKNLTLFHILVLISPSGVGIKDEPNQSLVKEARKYFLDCKNHPAVQYSDQIFRQMWYFPFNFIAFYYSEFPEAEPIREFPQEYDIDDNMRAMIANYITQVRDFYDTSNFDQFWTDHVDTMRSILNDVKENFTVMDLPEMMEAFYGSQVERFYLVPCPFMTSSATHVEVEECGEWTFYHLAGPGLFSDSFLNAYTAFHEFSHSFIEPISRRYSNQIDQLAYLYKPLQERFARMGYRDWDRAFNEHMVTAGQLQFTGKVFGDERKTDMLKREKERGFQLIERFDHYFQDYDQNRDPYKNLHDYYPVLLEDLATIQVDSFRTAGPMGLYPEYRNDNCYIMDVVAGSAMEMAGIKKNDVLVAIEDIDISSPDKLKRAKEKYWNTTEEGVQITIRIKRNGEIIKHRVSVQFTTKYQYLLNNK